MIDHEHRYIFVHIQKTAGTSLRVKLSGQPRDPHKHYTARELRQIYGNDHWDSYYKFSFVRNPWDRLVAWWSAIDGQRDRVLQGEVISPFRSFILHRANSFEEFLTRCDEDVVVNGRRMNIFRNQIDYLVNDCGVAEMNFIGRFERLHQDIGTLLKALGLEQAKDLPHRNKSRHGHYTEYYKPALIQLVADRYARDIEAFGYRYGC